MNWATLSRLDPESIRRFQEKKLRHFFRHLLPYSPHYRELFARQNLKFDAVETFDDLKRVPFTSKEDLAPTEENRAKPRAFILQPDEHLLKKHAPKSLLLKLLAGKIAKRDVKWGLEREFKPVHIHFTTGRTALPTPFTYSWRDLETLKETGMRLLDVGGLSRDLVALNAFPYSPHLGFWLAYYAMVQVGMTSLASGGGKVMGTQKIIDALERLKVNLAAFIPGYCYHLLREAVKQKRDFSNLHYIIFGAERVSPGLREKIRELAAELGSHELTILATYALTEAKTAWLQCAEGTGYHLYPDLEFFEVVDKEGNRVADGEPGELVYTALDWRGTVVVRYRTGDKTAGMEMHACPNCGRTVPRIRPDIQRVSDIREFHLTKVKGELINLNNFYPLLASRKDIEEWQVELKKRDGDPFGLDEIWVHVTPKAGVRFADLEADLTKVIRNEITIAPRIDEVKLDDLLARLGMETELKEKRILDSRPKG
jgi:phenylacetate-coenzyme A ligase PaaK-like adenylate-forming protein